MKIAGLQKLTVLDFPGYLACNIFTAGCNFRCPFCHNSTILSFDAVDSISTDKVLSYLKKRSGVLNGVCLTGGEPLLQPDLEDFIVTLRSMDYSIKLDTNGSNPEKLKNLIDKNLLDYVAVDIKNSRQKYAQTAGRDVDTDKIDETVRLLMTGNVEYEFRTTVVNELHCESDFDDIGKWIAGANKYFLQRFVDSGSVLCDGMHASSAEQMAVFLNTIQKYVPSAKLR